MVKELYAFADKAQRANSRTQRNLTEKQKAPKCIFCMWWHAGYMSGIFYFHTPQYYSISTLTLLFWKWHERWLSLYPRFCHFNHKHHETYGIEWHHSTLPCWLSRVFFIPTQRSCCELCKVIAEPKLQVTSPTIRSLPFALVALVASCKRSFIGF